MLCYIDLALKLYGFSYVVNDVVDGAWRLMMENELALMDVRFPKGDALARLDSFFVERLRLNKGGMGADVLPDDFMVPSGEWRMPMNVMVEDTAVGRVPIRIYRNRDARCQALLLWLHGGGFTQGDLDLPEAHAFCAEMTSRHAVTCVSVDYSLTANGESVYPAAMHEVMEVWDWMSAQTFSDGGLMPVLAIGGASAGANLAAAACLSMESDSVPHAAPELFCGAYGVYHDMQSTLVEGWNENTVILPQPLRFTSDVCRAMYADYVGVADEFPGYSTPGSCDLANFPPSALVCCEFDDLAPSSIAFADQLRESGVPVSIRMAPGVLHGVLNWYPSSTLPQNAAIIEFFAANIRSRFDEERNVPMSDRPVEPADVKAE